MPSRFDGELPHAEVLGEGGPRRVMDEKRTVGSGGQHALDFAMQGVQIATHVRQALGELGASTGQKRHQCFGDVLRVGNQPPRAQPDVGVVHVPVIAVRIMLVVLVVSVVSVLLGVLVVRVVVIALFFFVDASGRVVLPVMSVTFSVLLERRVRVVMVLFVPVVVMILVRAVFRRSLLHWRRFFMLLQWIRDEGGFGRRWLHHTQLSALAKRAGPRPSLERNTDEDEEVGAGRAGHLRVRRLIGLGAVAGLKQAPGVDRVTAQLLDEPHLWRQTDGDAQSLLTFSLERAAQDG